MNGKKKEAEQNLLRKRFAAAFAAHQAGQLSEAAQGYQWVIDRDARHIDALHLLGLIRQQRGQLAEAEKLIRKALSVREEGLLLGNLAVVLRDARRLDEAEAAFRRAIELKPDHVDAYVNLGALLHDTRRLAEAEAIFRRAIERKPDQASTHHDLGHVLRDAGRFDEAAAAYRRTIELQPNHGYAHCDLGTLLQLAKRLDEAEAAYRRAIELKPDHADAHSNLGLVLRDTRRFRQAEAACRRAIELKPSHADAHSNLGLVLWDTQRLDEAEAAFRRAIELKPDHGDAHNSLSLVLRDAGRLDEAEAASRRAIELKPNHANSYCNLGVVLGDLRRLDEAEAAYRRAIELKPDYADASFNLSLVLLSLERYQQGWPLYESRYAPARTRGTERVPALAYPQWQGESLEGKSLVMWPEQGFGDFIQLVRYAPLLKARGLSRLSLLCPTPLKTLLETVEGVDAVETHAARLPAHDFWSFVMSLPLHFGTNTNTIPAQLPYLRAPQPKMQTWQGSLPPGFKVGLAWRGSTAHRNDANRSLPGLASLAPLWNVPGISFISLQKGAGQEEASHPPPGQAIVPLADQIRDFADAAAVVSQLDLVICVDTALAHLTGALGKPCWVLLPALGTDWRWLLDRTDSPWYPGVMRLFRQSTLGNWTETIEQVAAALERLTTQRTTAP